MTRIFKEPPLEIQKVEPLQKWLETKSKELTKKTYSDAKNSKGKIAVEIGCGVGFHPIHWAQENPDSILIAFERTKEKFSKFNRRLFNHPEITNILPIHGDAFFYLNKLFAPKSIDEIFILYPNPYPKTSHKNLRFAHSLFLPEIAKLLKPGGTLTLATNLLFYADECIKNIPFKSGQLLTNILNQKIDPHIHTPRSHFEKKYLSQNQACYNLIFQRATS